MVLYQNCTILKYFRSSFECLSNYTCNTCTLCAVQFGQDIWQNFSYSQIKRHVSLMSLCQNPRLQGLFIWRKVGHPLPTPAMQRVYKKSCLRRSSQNLALSVSCMLVSRVCQSDRQCLRNKNLNARQGNPIFKASEPTHTYGSPCTLSKLC